MDKTKEREVIDKAPKQLFIGGRWRDASEGRTLEVEDPSSGAALCEVANATPEDATAALAAAVATGRRLRRVIAERSCAPPLS